MNKKRTALITACVVMLVVAFSGISVSAQGESGTTLSATVTATPHWQTEYKWTITKSVTPDKWDLFQGDSGTSKYTVTVTKDSGTQTAWVEGDVSVTNGGAVATENLAITAVLQDGYGSPNDFLTSAPVSVSGNPVLGPGETGTYHYTVAIPITGGAFPQPHAGGTYKVTADVVITNHSGHLGNLWGPSPSATTDFPASLTLINDQIHVTDTNGGSWTFSDSGSQSYEKTFTAAGAYDNTATITETGQSASASVTVNVYNLEVTKDAQTSLTRTYDWQITKTAVPSGPFTLAIGQAPIQVQYTVIASVTGHTDSDWKVLGTITIKNPAPIVASLQGVEDTIGSSAAVTLLDPVPTTVPAAVNGVPGSVTIRYTVDQATGTETLNTAKATLINHDYYYNKDPTANGGTQVYTGTATVDWTKATITEKDKSVDVTDTWQGTTTPLGSASAPNGGTFTYYHDVGPYDTCGARTVDNTATFTTSDYHKTGDASLQLGVNVPCAGGCSLTIGYWKTHAGFGPQADVVTKLLPIWLGTSGGAKSVQVESAEQAVNILSFKGSNGISDSSNGINKLYAQLLGAKLNIANGADGSAVSTKITSADAWLTNHNSGDWSSLSKTDKQKVLGWMMTLDNYNNGLVGPGHCSE